MTDQMPSMPRPETEERSMRPVIEHALVDYGYSPETATTLIERLLTERRDN